MMMLSFMCFPAEPTFFEVHHAWNKRWAASAENPFPLRSRDCRNVAFSMAFDISSMNWWPVEGRLSPELAQSSSSDGLGLLLPLGLSSLSATSCLSQPRFNVVDDDSCWAV